MPNAQTQYQIKCELEHLMKCPVDWPVVTKQYEYPHNWLLFDWYKCLLETAVSVDEGCAVREFANFGELITNYDIHTMKNFKLRIVEAKQLYAASSGRLSNLRFLPPSHDGKHFKPGLSISETLEKSLRSPSLFFRGHTSDEINAAFWRWFVDYFDTPFGLDEYIGREPHFGREDMSAIYTVWSWFEEDQQFRLAVRVMKDVGAVDGKSTEFACFDVSLSVGVVHAYPVSEAEALQIMPKGGLQAVRAFG